MKAQDTGGQFNYAQLQNVYTTHMPRVQIYLTDETYIIYQEIENKSLWVQDKLYELEKENKDG